MNLGFFFLYIEEQCQRQEEIMENFQNTNLTHFSGFILFII